MEVPFLGESDRLLEADQSREEAELPQPVIVSSSAKTVAASKIVCHAEKRPNDSADVTGGVKDSNFINYS